MREGQTPTTSQGQEWLPGLTILGVFWLNNSSDKSRLPLVLRMAGVGVSDGGAHRLAGRWHCGGVGVYREWEGGRDTGAGCPPCDLTALSPPCLSFSSSFLDQEG